VVTSADAASPRFLPGVRELRDADFDAVALSRAIAEAPRFRRGTRVAAATTMEDRMRHPLARCSSIATLVAITVFAASSARADVPPPDTCTVPGQPCQNAGPQYDQSGVCVATTCTKQVPSADGGMMPMTYACNRCEVPDGGSGVGGTGGSTTHPSSGSSGCAIAPGDAGSGHAVPAIILLAGLALAAARRRTSVG
jgi:MYXO-CTERM domain-containing protein